MWPVWDCRFPKCNVFWKAPSIRWEACGICIWNWWHCVFKEKKKSSADSRILHFNTKLNYFHSSGMFRLAEERVKWYSRVVLNLIICYLINDYNFLYYGYWWLLKNIKSPYKISTLIFLYWMFIISLPCRNSFIEKRLHLFILLLQILNF